MLKFGQKVQCGNFTVEKVSVALTKAQLKALYGIDEKKKVISRATVPYIIVYDRSRTWKISYGPTMAVFNALDTIEVDKDGNLGEGDMNALRTFINLMYADTTIFGDREYWVAKETALQEFIKRHEKDGDKEDEGKALDEVKQQTEVKESLNNLEESLKNESAREK